MSFWDDLKEGTENLNLTEMAEDTSSSFTPPKAQDYYCKVKSWKFDKTKNAGTPCCECVLEIVAPKNGVAVDEFKGKTIFHSLWLTGPRAATADKKASQGGLKFALQAMSVMSGKLVDSLEKMQKAELGECVFALVGNKIEQYKGADQFRSGFVNAMSKKDHANLADMGVEGSSSTDVEDDKSDFDY